MECVGQRKYGRRESRNKLNFIINFFTGTLREILVLFPWYNPPVFLPFYVLSLNCSLSVTRNRQSSGVRFANWTETPSFLLITLLDNLNVWRTTYILKFRLDWPKSRQDKYTNSHQFITLLSELLNMSITGFPGGMWINLARDEIM